VVRLFGVPGAVEPPHLVHRAKGFAEDFAVNVEEALGMPDRLLTRGRFDDRERDVRKNPMTDALPPISE